MKDGLQPERTGLAWQRTALAAGVVAVLLLHAAARDGWGVLTIPAALAGAGAAALAIGGGLRERHLRHDPEPGPAAPVLFGVVTLLVGATAVTSFITFLL